MADQERRNSISPIIVPIIAVIVGAVIAGLFNVYVAYYNNSHVPAQRDIPPQVRNSEDIDGRGKATQPQEEPHPPAAETKPKVSANLTASNESPSRPSSLPNSEEAVPAAAGSHEASGAGRPTREGNSCALPGKWTFAQILGGREDPLGIGGFTANSFVVNTSSNGVQARIICSCIATGSAITLGEATLEMNVGGQGSSIPAPGFGGQYERQADGSFQGTTSVGTQMRISRQ